MNKKLAILLIAFSMINSADAVSKKNSKPNVLFILMDDLAYGHMGGLYNDTIKVSDFDPYFKHLVDSLEGYSFEQALEFSKTATPNLNKLADEGIVFTKAYATSNLCAPSRLGIATGCNQNRWGVYRNSDCEKHGIEPGTHLAERIKLQGYQTAHIGKWHIGTKNRNVVKDVLRKNGIETKVKMKELAVKNPEVYKQVQECGVNGSVIKEHHPLNNGFEYYYGYNTWGSQFYNSTLVWENFEHAGKQEGYNTDVFTNKALSFLKDNMKEDKPFYLQLHYHAVHDSLEPKAPDLYFNKFKSDSYTLNNFFAHLNAVDYNVKRIVDFLKANGEYENTMIVFTSDNGGMCGGSYKGHKIGSPLPGNVPFSGHKGNYYQGGIRIPMFVHWPKGIKQNRVESQMVSTMDVLPTVLDIAGGVVPEDIDGKSLNPLFKGNLTPAHSSLIWSGIHSNKWGYLINKTTKTHRDEDKFAPPAWVLVKGDYLLRFTGEFPSGVYTDFIDGRERSVELYNIKKDPSEQKNIAKLMPEKVKELSKLYFKQSANYPPPASWKKEKWDELKSSEELF